MAAANGMTTGPPDDLERISASEKLQLVPQPEKE
jgi:hypothetical protein